MSIFEDNSGHRMSRGDVYSAIDSTDTLDPRQRAYAKGYFAALDDTIGIRGESIERALDRIRDRTDDDITGDETERLRESLEGKFQASL